MPLYKDADQFECKNLAAFDPCYEPGTLAPYTGIYACEWCGYEHIANAGDALPDARVCDEHKRGWWIPTRESGFFNRAKWQLVAIAVQTDAIRQLK